jgi:drug/metabolite transporter (DMT)-like permease
MQISTKKSMSSIEWFLLFLLSFLWGGSFFFSKVALSELQPLTIVLARVSIAAFTLYIIVRATGQRMPTSPKTWSAFLGMGLLNNLIPFSLIFWGQTQISSSLAAILNASTPIWTVILAHYLTKDERITPNKLGGVLLGLFGVVVLIGFNALAGLRGNVLAQLAVVGATISYAFAGIYGKRFQGKPPIVTATGQVTGTILMMIPIVMILDRPWTLSMPGLNVWAALIGLALLSTTLAYIIYFRLLSTAGATNLLLVTLLIPVSAIFLGMVFLDEQLGYLHFVGIGLIGLSLLVIDGRIIKILKNRIAGPIKTRPSISEEKYL